MSRIPIPWSPWQSWWGGWPSRPAGRSTAAVPLPAGEVEFEAGATLSFAPTPDLRIRATAGTLWVTQEGDGRDFTLEPGDCFVPAGGHGCATGSPTTELVNRPATA
jgi:hypothetical protein